MTKSRVARMWLGGLALSVILLAAAFYLDADVQRWSASDQTASLRTFMRAVSRWGDGASHVAAGIVGAAIAYLLGSRRWTVIFLVTIIACAMAGLLHPVLKVATGRSRPPVVSDVGWNGPRFDAKHQAFPSGHTISSAAFFGVLICACRRIGLLFLPVPLIIAASRVYLNAHHLSDVVAGVILGAFCAVLAWHYFSGRVERYLVGRV